MEKFKFRDFLLNLFKSNEDEDFESTTFFKEIGDSFKDFDFSKLNRFYEVPFSYELAKMVFEGKREGKVITRAGRRVVLLSLDVNHDPKLNFFKNDSYTILAVFADSSSKVGDLPFGCCAYFTSNGRYGRYEDDNDLTHIKLRVKDFNDFMIYFCQTIERKK